MSTTNDDNILINELVEKIHQFLNYQIENNDNLSESAKESLTVANECIEQSFRIQKKSSSKELLDLYKSHKTSNSHQQPSMPNIGATLVQNLANTILSQATAGASTRSQDATGTTDTGASPMDSSPLAQAAAMAQQIFGAAAAGVTTNINNPTPTQSTPSDASNTTTSSTQQQQQQAPPKVRKSATESEKMAAEGFKNLGNDAMKQDRYQEALDYYSQAISIDDNNAIYYSNRAAAKSKMGDHQGALNDCREAIEIDPTYSKAYGRMGLAYASLEDHRQARDAYMKAVELDPTNESYNNNLMIAEEKLGEGANATGAGGFNIGGAAAGGGQNDMMSMLRSMMNNPQLMQMAMRSLQDPRMQSLFTNLAGNLGGAGGGANGNQQPPPTHQ